MVECSDFTPEMMSRLAGVLQPGDHIAWGQGTAEPTPITQAIAAGRHDLRPGGVFVGAAFTNTLRPEHADVLKISSYGTLGTTRALAAAGALDIIPSHVSRLGRCIRDGEIPCDVAVVQLSLPGPNGKPSLGVINDYMRAAMLRARVVVAEVNDQMPWTYGPEPVGLDRIALKIETSRPLVAVRSKPPTPTEKAIAHHVASLIDDGATLQVGIGGTIDAVLQCLLDRRDLGVHSGTIGDGILDLIEAGVVTNARKTIDVGVTMTAALFGSERLFRFANQNPELAVHPYEYTHMPETLTKQANLIAINSAIEVDVTGQANAELTGGRYIGAVGGQVDFMHAATRSTFGRSIIALPSTAAGGTISRIRLRVDAVTCPRSEIDFVVTEYGCADLRGQAIRERIRRIIAVAHPDFQERLECESHAAIVAGF